MRITGLLLLALQTTTTAASDGRIDTVTLVLVVLFIAAMLGLSLAIRRQGVASPDEAPTDPSLPERPRQPEAPEPETGKPVDAAGHGGPALLRNAGREAVVESVPVWLQGVIVPAANAGLAEATQVIEALLAARRDRDLAAGMALYAPSAREALARSLGLDGDDSGADVMFDGDPPTLRSAEIVEARGDRVTVRVTYSNRASEVYVLIRIDQSWLISDIKSHR